VERLGLKCGTVAWNEKPMANLVSQKLDCTDGLEFTAELGIGGIGTVRKNQPDAIVPGRFVVIAEHTNDAVAQVNGET